MDPLVSVIIPTYDGAKEVTKCIESVLNQNYKNIEILVVDDNGIGTPNQIETAEAMARYKLHGNVFYHCHEVNINGSAARNTGVRISHGDYIALLDDDDIFLPNRIERQVTLLERLPKEIGAVYCSHETFLNGNKVGEEHAKLSGNLLYEYMSHKLEIASSAIMIRKEVYEDLNGFDESFKRHQDWEFISRMLAKYKIQGDDFYGFERHLVFRNSRVSPDVVKQRREYYLEKMKPILNKLPTNKAHEIIVNERFTVALAYLKNKRYLSFMKELINSGDMKRSIILLGKRYSSFLKRGGKLIR